MVCSTEIVAVKDEASSINLSFNILVKNLGRKHYALCMVFNPHQKCKVVVEKILQFILIGCELFVIYLKIHIIRTVRTHLGFIDVMPV